MADKNINILKKLPVMFLGSILGMTFGNIAGILFRNMNIGTNIGIYWVPVFIFLGALFGAILGYNYEE